MKAHTSDYVIANCYAPCATPEKTQFLELLKRTLQTNENINTIVAGDFNTTMDNSLDNIAGLPHADKEMLSFRETVASLDLHDIWRTHHPLEKQYTWSRPNPFTARRLDYIFCDTYTLSKLSTSTIETFAHSDHKMVKITIKSNDFKRGPGYWKFNASLLTDD